MIEIGWVGLILEHKDFLGSLLVILSWFELILDWSVDLAIEVFYLMSGFVVLFI